MALTKISALGLLAALDALWIGFASGLAAISLLIWTFGASWSEWLSVARGAGRSVAKVAVLGARGGAFGGRALGSGLEATSSLARKGLHSVGRKEPSFSGKPSQHLSHSGQSVRARKAKASAPVLKVEPETAPVSLTVKPTKPAKVEQTSFDLGNAGEYELPGIELLTEAAEGVAGPPSQALQQNARMLEAVLADFGVKGEIGTIGMAR